MTAPRLTSTRADPPRGCRRAWGGPAPGSQRSPRAQASASSNRSGEQGWGLREHQAATAARDVAGLGVARRPAPNVPLARKRVLFPTGAVSHREHQAATAARDVAGLGVARRPAPNVPLARKRVLFPTGAVSHRE